MALRLWVKNRPKSNWKIASAVLLAFYLSFAGFLVASGEVPPDAEAIVEKILATQAEDEAEWQSATGTGMVDFINADGSEVAVWNFRFRKQNRSLWAEYVLLREGARLHPVRDYDMVRLVADGDDIVSGCFSPRLNPSGCKAEVYSDELDRFHMASHVTRLDPRRNLFPLLPISSEGISVFHNPQSTVSILVNKADEILIRISFRTMDINISADPQRGYRITHYELAPKDTPVPQLSLDFEWEERDGRFSPHEITMKQIDLQSLKRQHLYHMKFETLSNRLTPEESTFSIEQLALEQRTVFVDHRPMSKTRRRDFDVKVIKKASQEGTSLQATIKELPQR